MTPLTQQQKKFLKGKAHHLNPVVQVGKEGPTDKVLAMINKALNAHELIKVQILDASGMDRKKDSKALAEKVNAHLVQVLGFKLILYRENPEDPKIALPK